MRYLAFFCTCLLAVSCSETQDDVCANLTDCPATCEFVLQEQMATTAYLGCFDAWGVTYEDGETSIGLIIDDLAAEYQVDNMQVSLCGYARTNELPMSFPDPSLDEVYQFEALYIALVEQ